MVFCPLKHVESTQQHLGNNASPSFCGPSFSIRNAARQLPAIRVVSLLRVKRVLACTLSTVPAAWSPAHGRTSANSKSMRRYSVGNGITEAVPQEGADCYLFRGFPAGEPAAARPIYRPLLHYQRDAVTSNYGAVSYVRGSVLTSAYKTRAAAAARLHQQGQTQTEDVAGDHAANSESWYHCMLHSLACLYRHCSASIAC